VVTTFFTVLSFSIFFIDQVRDSIEDRYTLYFHTFTTQTLQPRAPVWLAGQSVGHVSGMEFLPPAAGTLERLRVELNISASAQPFITEGAAAQVIASALLGEAVVNILPTEEPGVPLADRSELPTARSLDPFEVTGRLRTVYDSVLPVAERWRVVLDEARNGPGTLPRLMRSPDDLFSLHRDLTRLAAAFDTVRIVAEDFSHFTQQDEVREALDRLGPRLGQLARQWQGTEGTVGGFADDSVFAASIEGIAATLERLNDRIDGGKGTLGRLLNDRVLNQELERTSQMIRDLRSDLSRMRR
jgi:ABC-type transporter Mla subunit MlaD